MSTRSTLQAQPYMLNSRQEANTLKKRSHSMNALEESIFVKDLVAKLSHHRSEFLVVDLKPTTQRFVGNTCVVRCGIMEDRDGFIECVREKGGSQHIGFETMRRAVHSTS